MGEQRPVVIIKRVKKADHGGSHGGSWKVAYADFVTAMMAFFLLMWLIAMVDPVKREKVSRYFKEYNVFESKGSSLLDYDKELKIQVAELTGKVSSGPAQEVTGQEVEDFQQRFAESLRQEIEQKLSDVKDQILIRPFENGVRVEIVDRDGSPMFPLSSSALTPKGSKVLSVIAQTLAASNHLYAVEGHTDARIYNSLTYSNWELSTARASAARFELENAGLSSHLLVRVSGFASTQPLIKEDPMNPMNRRISILVFK